MRLIIETIVFVLNRKKKENDALNLIALTEENDNLPDILNTLRSMLSNLELDISEDYLKQEQAIKSLQEEKKRNEAKDRKEKEIRSSITYAQNLAKRKQFNQAIAKPKEILSMAPENALAILQTFIIWDLSKR
jgi:hypothetical protein